MSIQYEQVPDLQTVKDRFYRMTAHPYLEKYVQCITVDEDYVFFLSEIFYSSHVPQNERIDHIVSALLVKAALDTHESVSSNTVKTDHMEKTRQLTVLAGDFYTSLYYYLLAEKNDDSILQIFSQSIQQINEDKMVLHMTQQLTEKELIQRMSNTETLLLKNIATQYGKDFLCHLADSFFALRRLRQEEKRTLKNRKLSSVAAAIHRYIEGQASQSVPIWPSEGVYQWIQKMSSQLRTSLQEQMMLHKQEMSHVLTEKIMSSISAGETTKEQIVEEG